MKNLKLLVFIIFALFFENNIVAQLFVEIGTGYSMPIYYKNNSNSGFMDIYSYTDNQNEIDTSYYIENKYNMGNGIDFNGEIGYKLDNQFVISINTLFLNNINCNMLYSSFAEIHYGEYFIINEITNQYAYSEFTHTSLYYGQRLSFTPKISYFMKFNKIECDVSLGTTLSYLKVYNNIESLSLSTFNFTGNSETIRVAEGKYKYLLRKNNHFSGYFAIAFYYSFSSNLDFKICAELNYLLGFYATEGTQYYYSQTNTENGIVKYSLEDENSYDVSDSYGLDREHYNFNTLNFSFGIRYTFGKFDEAKDVE